MELALPVGPSPEDEQTINSQCDLLDQEFGVRLTVLARHLLATVLTATEHERSSTWLGQEEEILARRSAIRLELEVSLRAFYRASVGGSLRRYFESGPAAPRELTTFDVLHWLTRRLDELCPFRKRDET